MAGIIETIAAAATDTSLAKLFDHPEMAEGTLFLSDPLHEYGAFAGVPLNGGSIPNVASRQALPLLTTFGASVATDLNGVVSYAADANGMLMERTAKGGVHGLPSQANQVTNSNSWVPRLPTAIKSYLLAKLPDDNLNGFYFSYWYKQTRGAVSGFVATSRLHMVQSTGTSSYAWHGQGSPLVLSGSLGSYSAAHANANGSIIAGGASSWTGAKPGVGSTNSALGGIGQVDQWVNSTNRNKAAGLVLYRMKLEDLRLNKRSNGGAGGTIAEEYAAALAADIAAFTAAFSAGGSLYGDTWSDVASFA